MAELMFFTRKEISPYHYAKDGIEGWTMECPNVNVFPEYYETKITADSDGKFPEDELPTITFNFGLEGDNVPNYGRFVADYFKIVKWTDDFGLPYYTEIKVDFFKDNEKVYVCDTTIKGALVYLYADEKYFCDIRDFNRVEIKFIKAPPAGKGRFVNFFIDLLYPKVLDNKPLIINKFSNFKIKEAINVLSDDMPMGSLECDIVSTSEFNIKKLTLFDVENNGKYYGRFVVVDFKRTGENVYHLSANSLKEVLEREEYSDWLSQSGRDPLKVMSDKTSIALGITFKDVYDRKEYGGYIDVGTCRYALCQYAWAHNVMATDARKSYVELIPIPKIVKHKITNLGGKQKIIGNATLNETPQFLNARYTVYDYDFFESGEVVDVGKITGIIADDMTYYFEKPPVLIDFKESNLNLSEDIEDYSSSKIQFKYKNAQGGNQLPNVTIIRGHQSTIREFTYLIKRAEGYQDSNASGTKEYDKYTLCAYDEHGSPNANIKMPMITKVLESRGEVKAKIVLEDEQVGDLVDIDTAFEGTIRGIITSMEYTPNYQTIADITILALDIGLEPLYESSFDENGKLVAGDPIYDKLDDIILVEGDV